MHASVFVAADTGSFGILLGTRAFSFDAGTEITCDTVGVRSFVGGLKLFERGLSYPCQHFTKHRH